MAWGDDHENSCIIATMMRLLPKEILHIIIYRHRYPTQSSLISFIRLCHPKYVMSPAQNLTRTGWDMR